MLWVILIFTRSYFLSHTSKSMWTNIPISILILAAFCYLCYQVELCWRVQLSHKQTYLSHLEKRQLSVNDSRLSTAPSASKWRRKIDSPPVEAAVDDFIDKILQDFVVDLWYSSITPDKDAPELIWIIILDVLGEILERIKDINLVDLLTRHIHELIESVFLASKDNSNGDVGVYSSSNAGSSIQDHSQSGELELKGVVSSSQNDLQVAISGRKSTEDSHLNMIEQGSLHDVHHRPADWAVILEAATKRRSQVLTPENLENMWTKGRNYKKKGLKSGTSSVPRKPSGAISTTDHAGNSGKLLVVNKNDDTVREGVIEGAHFDDGCEENARKYTKGSASLLKRSSSTSDINVARVRETGDSMTFKEPIGELTSHSEGSLLAHSSIYYP